MSDYSPPVPSDEQIDAAALDVANLARVKEMGKGFATFDRDTLDWTGWWDPSLLCDHGGGREILARVPPLICWSWTGWWDPSLLGDPGGGHEIHVRVPPLMIWSWQQHVRRCRLEVVQAIERFDVQRQASAWSLFAYLPAEERDRAWANLEHQIAYEREVDWRFYDEEWPPPKGYQPVRRSQATTPTRPSSVALSNGDDP